MFTSGNTSHYIKISNNNTDPSCLTLIPETGNDISSTYKCSLNVIKSGVKVSTISKDVTLIFEKTRYNNNY